MTGLCPGPASPILRGHPRNFVFMITLLLLLLSAPVMGTQGGPGRDPWGHGKGARHGDSGGAREGPMGPWDPSSRKPKTARRRPSRFVVAPSGGPTKSEASLRTQVRRLEPSSGSSRRPASSPEPPKTTTRGQKTRFRRKGT